MRRARFFDVTNVLAAFLLCLGLLTHGLASKTSDLQLFNCQMLTDSTGKLGDGLLGIGDTTMLCIHYLPFNIKIGFKVSVDQHLVLTTRNSFKFFDIGHNADYMVQLSNSELFSTRIVF